MRNMTVRASLLVALTMFGVVIVIGGIAGVVSLRMANANAQRLHEIARQTILVNDAYKDSTRTRSALVRAYSALKERNDTATRDSALQSANRTLERSASETRAYRDASAFDGMDAELKRQLVASSDGLAALLARAADALRNNDTAAYVTINDRDVTRAGMVYSQNVEKLQTLANTLTEQALNDGNARYQWIVGFVVVGVGLALALVVITHVALARIVTRPLGEAVAVLDRIASNDLTVRVPEAGRNEIGLLRGHAAHARRTLAHRERRARQLRRDPHCRARDRRRQSRSVEPHGAAIGVARGNRREHGGTDLDGQTERGERHRGERSRPARRTSRAGEATWSAAWSGPCRTSAQARSRSPRSRT
jgi:nitrogen fixation/metabolism regulation signal transduction histidine kinase